MAGMCRPRPWHLFPRRFFPTIFVDSHFVLGSFRSYRYGRFAAREQVRRCHYSLSDWFWSCVDKFSLPKISISWVLGSRWPCLVRGVGWRLVRLTPLDPTSQDLRDNEKRQRTSASWCHRLDSGPASNQLWNHAL